jgi:hypothetical protein
VVVHLPPLPHHLMWTLPPLGAVGGECGAAHSSHLGVWVLAAAGLLPPAPAPPPACNVQQSMLLSLSVCNGITSPIQAYKMAGLAQKVVSWWEGVDTCMY